MRRYFKKCEEFSICSEEGEANHIFAEHSDEPFHIYGFNSLSVDQDWSGKLIDESFDGDDNSYLICFKGNPIINGIKVESRDYAKLENKHYNVISNDSIIGVFTKL